MNKISQVLFAAAFLVASGSTPAQAETLNCTAITSLPYTISAQGVYCLTGHLNTASTFTSGNAITITTNNVVLDLNGFKIGGLTAGKGTLARGIFANQRQNITIKNGTVRGFHIGIIILDATPYTVSQGHLIEDIRADLNTWQGMEIQGKGNMVRNNMVVATGGTTAMGADAGASGIAVRGPGTRLLNNDVTEVAASGSGNAFGLYLNPGSNAVVSGNRVSTITSGTGLTWGIYINNTDDVLISDNRISGVEFGIMFDAPGDTGKYMNNMTMGVTTPYTGGTAAGTTNY